MTDIRPETPEDHDAIRAVHTEAFAPSPAEAALVDALRAAGDLVGELCLVATRGGRVVGHIAFSRARIGDHVVLALAPMAVLPECRREGVGAQLVRSALARATGFPLVVVLGHPGYYPRFGFVPARPLGIEPPFPGVPDEAWMALPLSRGTVEYAPAFAAL